MDLADKLANLRDSINTRRMRSTDQATRKALRLQADRVGALHRAIIEERLDENSLEYKKIVAVLDSALKQSQDALERLSDSVELVEKIAGIVNQVEKAVKSVAPTLSKML